MTRYVVVYIERATGRIESVVAQATDWSIADRLAGSMQPSAREGYYFTARSEQ